MMFLKKPGKLAVFLSFTETCCELKWGGRKYIYAVTTQLQLMTPLHVIHALIIQVEQTLFSLHLLGHLNKIHLMVPFWITGNQTP